MHAAAAHWKFLYFIIFLYTYKINKNKLNISTKKYKLKNSIYIYHILYHTCTFEKKLLLCANVHDFTGHHAEENQD